MDNDLFTAEIADDIRQLSMPAGLILADDACHGGPGHGLDQQHVQQAVVGLSLRHRIEAAAIPASVGHADQGLAAVKFLAVYLHHIVLVDALDQVDAGGENVGAGAGNQRQTLILADGGADAGIEAHGADVQGVVIPLAADQVKGGNVAVQEPVQILESPRLGEDLDKIIAGAARKMGDGGVAEAGGAVDHLIERSVTAAGVDAHRVAGGSRRAGDLRAVAGRAGHQNLIGQTALVAGIADKLGEFAGLVVFSRRRIDDKQMFHGPYHLISLI